MPLKRFFLAAALLVPGVMPAMCQAQDSDTSSAPVDRPAVADKPATPPRASKSAALGPSSTGASANANGLGDDPQPHITTVNQPQQPAQDSWPLPDRIKWLTEVLLVLIAYVGAWLGFSTLRKIERQTQYSEEAAKAAAEAAKAALLFAENQAKAERPWILITAAPVPGGTNSFSIMASNRGRSPARVVSLAECIAIVHDESELPRAPIYKTPPRGPVAPTILLPGESVSIKTFSRDEVRSVCETAEEAQRIEEWQEKIYLYGNVVYGDLSTATDAKLETGWCCWYIHGRQKSGMIMAGPPEYNRHT